MCVQPQQKRNFHLSNKHPGARNHCAHIHTPTPSSPTSSQHRKSSDLIQVPLRNSDFPSNLHKLSHSPLHAARKKKVTTPLHHYIHRLSLDFRHQRQIGNMEIITKPKSKSIQAPPQEESRHCQFQEATVGHSPPTLNPCHICFTGREAKILDLVEKATGSDGVRRWAGA